MDVSNSLRGRESRKSSLSVQKWELLLETAPPTDPAEILRNPRFSPTFKKGEEFFNPCRVESTEEPPESPDQRAEAPCRPQSARPKCEAIVLRVRWSRAYKGGTSGLPWRPGNPGPLRKQLPGTFPLRTCQSHPTASLCRFHPSVFRM